LMQTGVLHNCGAGGGNRTLMSRSPRDFENNERPGLTSRKHEHREVSPSCGFRAGRVIRGTREAVGIVAGIGGTPRRLPPHPTAFVMPLLASKAKNTKPRIRVGVARAREETVLRTLSEAARELGLAPSSVRARLCRHPKLFPTPRYRRDSGHPRRLRVLTAEDVRTLAMLLTSAGFKGRGGWSRRQRGAKQDSN